VETDFYIIALLIILLAYFIRGITGFGSGLIAIPLLAHLLPLTFVVPLILITDTTASVVMSHSAKLQVQWREIRTLLPSTVVGILIGTFLLINLPKEPLLLGLGAFIIFFALRYILNLHNENPISRWWAAPTGLIGGLIGAMFGTGGPPYVIYLSHRVQDKTKLVGTLSGLFMIDGGLRVISFLSMGLFYQEDMAISLLMTLPLMLLGLYLGQKVHLKISRRIQLGVIGGLLLLSGGSLIWKAMV